ncbi:MAG: hypothetical protein II114_01420 [Treponema sp.]|nr:hypothetical protein [Treponema sp.]MBQ4237455.1 hypothetical protein [Treponema sp.]
MKRFLITALALIIGAGAFAIDYATVSTRILDTLTSDSIFIAGCTNEKEVTLAFEKGMKDLVSCTVQNGEEFADELISMLQPKKEYDAAFAKAEKEENLKDIFDYNHFNFTFDDISDVVNAFKARLPKGSPKYYLIIMPSEYEWDYIFLYDAKSKKASMMYDFFAPDGYWDDYY